MKTEILSNIDNPRQLEKLYRQNKSDFRQQFSMVYPELKESKIADFWNERLNYESEDVYWGTTRDIIFVIIAAIIADSQSVLPSDCYSPYSGC